MSATQKPVFIVDIFEGIVQAVSTKLINYLQTIDPAIEAVNYLHGHPKEIIETLMQRDKSDTFQFKKYPLVALFQDFPENHNQQIGIDNEASLHLVIVQSTRPDYKADERYTKNFKPILYPIYMELLQQISFSKAILNYGVGDLPHTKIDRLYWGKEGIYGSEANVFNDFLDCIELRDLKLKINMKFCSQN